MKNNLKKPEFNPLRILVIFTIVFMALQFSKNNKQEICTNEKIKSIDSCGEIRCDVTTISGKKTKILKQYKRYKYTQVCTSK